MTGVIRVSVGNGTDHLVMFDDPRRFTRGTLCGLWAVHSADVATGTARLCRSCERIAARRHEPVRP
jgi:hypothetical protein